MSENFLSKKATELISNWPEWISYPSAPEKNDWHKVGTYYSNSDGAITDPDSLFFSKEHRMRGLDIFIFAMALGKNRNNFLPWDSLKGVKPQPNMPKSALREYEIWLMASVAISHENSTAILNDPRKIISICEGYANGGIALLMTWDSNGLSSFEEQLTELYQKLK